MRVIHLFALVLAGALYGCAQLRPAANAPSADMATTPVETPVAKPPTNIDPNLMFELLVAEIAGQRGQMEFAARHYALSADATNDPRVAERAVRIAVFAKQQDHALHAARRWVLLDADNLEAQQTLAILALRAGHRDEALRALARIVELAKGNDQTFALVATLLSREPDLDAAVATMGELMKLRPNDAHAHYAFGQLAATAGQHELALQNVERALALQPNWSDAELLQARLLMALDRKPEAMQVFAVALRRDPSNAELRLAYARLLVDQGKVSEAKREFKVLARQEPDNPDVRFALGLLAVDAKDAAGAREHLQHLLKLGSHQNEARYYLGLVEEREDNREQAIKWFEQVDGGDYWLDARARIARMRADAGDVEGVRQQLEILRASHPELAVRLYLVEGEILMRMQRFQETYDFYNALLVEHVDDSDLLYGRALAAEKLGLLDVLEQDLRKVLAQDPENAHALNALGYTLADRTDRFAEARDYISRALVLRPDDPAIIDSMGWLEYRQGNHAEAVKHLQHAFTESGDAEVGAHLGEVLWVMGRRDEARKVWAQARKTHPENAALLETMRRLQP